MGILDYFRKNAVQVEKRGQADVTVLEPQTEAVKRYTAADVHAEITARVLVMMETLKQQVEEVFLPAEVAEELDILKSVGLTNSRNMKALADAEKRVNDVNERRRRNAECLKLVRYLHKHYGEDCMLMSLEDFMALIEKYNLSCGFLNDYSGSIPKKNLRDIKRASEFLKDLEGYEDSSTNLSQFLFERANKIVNEARPEKVFLASHIKKYERITECDKEYVAANPDVVRFPFVEKNPYGSYIFGKPYRTSYDSSRLLIAAPSQEMNTLVKISERIRTEDPFVFSVGKQGVIIYSAWGDEGNDEVVQKYRKINEWIASCEALKRLEE